MYGNEYKPLLTDKVLDNILNTYGLIGSGSSMPEMSNLLDRHMKALLFKYRLARNKCISCGGETEAAYLESGEDVVSSPACQRCLAKGLSPEEEKFLEGMGLSKDIMTFLEEPTDPSKMEERFSYPEDEEREASKLIMLQKLAKIANQLDDKGFYEEANEIDELIRQTGERDNNR